MYLLRNQNKLLIDEEREGERERKSANRGLDGEREITSREIFN